MTILRLLNQAAERRAEVDGMERVELERAMRNFWAFQAGESDFLQSLRLLAENGLISQTDRPQYAWDRGRILRKRYSITPLGKAYLVRQITETGRIR
jgi:DNA-binding PadR family transcriptional regulator